jgi:acyl-CoA synthetase (NDP forming)
LGWEEIRTYSLLHKKRKKPVSLAYNGLLEVKWAKEMLRGGFPLYMASENAIHIFLECPEKRWRYRFLSAEQLKIKEAISCT